MSTARPNFSGVTVPRAEALAFSDDAASVSYAEIHLAASSQVEVEGSVQKEILRTGHWPVLPTRGGVMKTPLTVVRDGRSDKAKGVLALSELVENFRKVGQRVQIPLTDDDDDHKNSIRVNTGFVTDLWIEDTEGGSRLVAKMEFTEPDVKEKVLRGTYADVSCGIPWEFASRGEAHGAYLEHVAITNRPFIDDLGPFLALSDRAEGKLEIDHFTASDPAEGVEPPASPPPGLLSSPEVRVVDAFGGLSLRQVIAQAHEVLPEDLKPTFHVVDVKAEGVIVQNDDAKMSWLVPFKVQDGKFVASTSGWAYLKYDGEAKPLAEHKPAAPSQEPPPEEPPSAPQQPESSGDPVDEDLEAARRVRRMRVSGVAAAAQPTIKEAHMPLTREELERLDLSAMPDDQRAVFQKLLNENSDLAMSSREAQAGERVKELEDLGFKDKPGALKLYRQVMLGDDGGPAVVVLSDSGKKETKTALSILDEFIEAIKGAEGKVVLSDQAVLVPGDAKPPLTPEGEKQPLEDRVAATRAALTGVQSG